MSGSNDQSTPRGRNGSGEGVDRVGKDYECVGRIAKIPFVESTASVVSSLYSSVKQSNYVVETVFENVEEGWSKGAEIVGPFTSKIEETLERPLKAIDNAACVGLDFFEDKITSVKIPPDHIYERSKDYVARNVIEPAAQFTSVFMENLRDKVYYRSRKSSMASELGKNGTEDSGCKEIGDNKK